MSQSTPFEEHLAVGESSVAVGSGTLFQEIAWTPSAICVTDRRILFVPEDGGFVDVPRRRVQSIRSRPTTRRSGRAIGGLGLLVGGVVLAAIAAWGLLSGGAGVAVLAFAFLAAAGTVATGTLVVGDVELSGDQVAAGVGRGVDAIAGLLARVDDAVDRQVDVLDGSTGEREHGEHLARVVDEWPVLQWLAAGLGVVGTAGLVLLGAWTALGLTAIVLVGIGAAAFGHGYLCELDARDQRVRHERSVCLYLLDGRTIRFRIDDDASIDRELSKLTADGPTTPSPADARTTEDGPAEHGASTGP